MAVCFNEKGELLVDAPSTFNYNAGLIKYFFRKI